MFQKYFITHKITLSKENKAKVTILLRSLNRKMIVPKEKFIERIENGEYNVLNGYQIEKTAETPAS